MFENSCNANSHNNYNENFVVFAKACGRKWESNNQLCLALPSFVSSYPVNLV